MAVFLDDKWCDLAWTAFVPFDGQPSLGNLPDLAGVYRVRVVGKSQLAYIGQTGRSLRERLWGLRRHTLADEMPFNDPHTAACRLWSYRDADGVKYECSAAPVDLPKPERMALECFLVWQYRLECGQSTLCNFGRLHPSYQPSRNRSTGIRGCRLPDGGQDQLIVPSVPPFKQQGDPTTAGWMNLAWGPLQQLRGDCLASVPAVPGVYKLLDDHRRLLYVGESANLYGRLLTHRQRSWGGRDICFSTCVLPEFRPASQRLEIENDLIAGYYATTKQAPTVQFGTA